MRKSFKGILQKQDRLTFIDIPFNPAIEFGIKGKIELEITINNISAKKALLSRGNGKYIITFNKDLMNRMGILPGETCSVTLSALSPSAPEPESDPYVLELYENVKEKSRNKEELNVLEAIFTRRSIREFTAQKIEDDQIELLLKAGSYAPSAENKRPIDYILIRDRDTLNEVSSILPRGKMIKNSGCAVVVTGDNEAQKQKGFLIEDGSASIQNILLAAHGINLSAVWCGVYPISKFVKELRSTLKIPEHIIPIGVVAIGYPDEEKVLANRFDKKKVHFESW